MEWINRKEIEPDANITILAFCKTCKTAHCVIYEFGHWSVPQFCNLSGPFLSGRTVEFDYWMPMLKPPEDGMDQRTFKAFYNTSRGVIITAIILFLIFMTVKGFAFLDDSRNQNGFVYDVEPPDIESVARDHDREVHKEAGIERDDDGNGRV